MCFAALRIESSPVSKLIIKRSYTVLLTQVASASDAVAAPADFGSVALPFLLYISLLSVLHACFAVIYINYFITRFHTAVIDIMKKVCLPYSPLLCPLHSYN